MNKKRTRKEESDRKCGHKVPKEQGGPKVAPLHLSPSEIKACPPLLFSEPINLFIVNSLFVQRLDLVPWICALYKNSVLLLLLFLFLLILLLFCLLVLWESHKLLRQF